MQTDEQFDRILNMLTESKEGIDELKQAMQEKHSAKDEFDAWKPEVDKTVSNLQIAVDNLGYRDEQLIADSTPTLKCDGSPIDHPEPVLGKSYPLQASATAHLVASSSKEAASGPQGHRVENQNWGTGFGTVYTISSPPPVTGANKFPNKPSIPFSLEPPSHRDQSSMPNGHHAFSQLNFPEFDGTNPKLWIRRCETFFDVYSVAKHLWVSLATMNFIGSAAFWLQSIQSRLATFSWEELGAAMCARFDRDEQNHLVRQFFCIKQNHYWV
ncbi:hypothetical protein GQ55_7G007700 [Panicum hallii var. hallii]|uniref:Retrotransposon gag domain-containing protein n=1 Tax=Panicum hallii var. hallii TaxID=1504633 RepID=A0A2T7CRL5_9POAL|nr:hypothetical protein GQ55_7G007700 [Panicum hallii var. hallii]